MNRDIRIRKDIPNSCGVYLFKDNEEVLYVGKAKNLNNRIKQYLNGSINSYKTPILMERANNIDFIVCSNEKESLLLEQQLIKKYKPYYNILLLDDKKYPYIVIKLKSNSLEFKTSFFYRQSPNTYYYGPLPPNYGYKTIKNFLIRECLYEDGLPIKSNNQKLWESKFDHAKKILSSQNSEIINRLKRQMIEASENEQYELAKDFRDVILYLTNKSQNQSITFENEINFDVVAFEQKNEYLFVLIHYFKNGNFFLQEDFVVEIKIDLYETITSFLNEFYSMRSMPDMLVTNFEINKEDIFFDKKIIIPKKGQYANAISNALKNINILYKERILQFKKAKEQSKKVNELFNYLTGKKINDFFMIDNSNEDNKDVVSTIIYYKNYFPYYSNYRKYSLVEDIRRKSDVEYIKQGLQKYFANKEKLPDLIIVDGGIQQINEAKKILLSFKIDLPVIGIVKNKKHVTDHIIDTNLNNVEIKDRDIYNFLSRVQTEVDSFAKKFHSSKKINSSLEGFLTSVEGIGQKTEEKLLEHFGTYANIYNASEEELSKIVSKAIAKKIKENLKK